MNDKFDPTRFGFYEVHLVIPDTPSFLSMHDKNMHLIQTADDMWCLFYNEKKDFLHLYLPDNSIAEAFFKAMMIKVS